MVQNEKPINFFEQLAVLKEEMLKKEAFIFLDYDGTLTPIVDTPDQAIISEEMRATVRKLSRHYKVSIVSGRATDDVRGKAQIEKIFYAGSHGFEIVDPDGYVKISEKAQQARAVIDEVHQKLSAQLKDVKGALVEHVKYTISTHYRLVAEENLPEIVSAVEGILKEYPQLYKTSGKKVFEIRPRIDWHKGKAVEWILKVLGYDPNKHLAVYIGDDVTDEDAFAALDGKGFGILVAEEPRDSKAAYMIKDTHDVRKVLDFFIRIKEEKRQG